MAGHEQRNHKHSLVPGPAHWNTMSSSSSGGSVEVMAWMASKSYRMSGLGREDTDDTTATLSASFLRLEASTF